MNKRKELAKMIQEWADNPDSYFKYDIGTGWETSRFVPNMMSDLSYWRLVIPPKEIELEKGDYTFNSTGIARQNYNIEPKCGTTRMV